MSILPPNYISQPQIGEMKVSTLSEEKFIQENGKHWELADGRSCKGSRYEIFSGNRNVPNMMVIYKEHKKNMSNNYLIINYFIKIN